MKTILIPTDFSDNAYNALSYGVQLFDNKPCKFILLNTYLPIGINQEYGINYPVTTTVDDYDEQNTEKRLERILTKIKKDFPDNKHRFEIISSINLIH